MDEQNISLMDPDETTPDMYTAGMDLEDIDGDWNKTPEENWGRGTAEDEDRPETDGENDDESAASGVLANGGKTGDMMNGREADQSFTLKHLSEVKTVGRDEVITLAQKGLDYDRIRGKFDEANAALGKSDEAVSLLKDLAAVQGVTPEQIIDATRAQLLVQQHGIAPSLAMERVMAMRASKGNQQIRTPENVTDEKRQTEIREFISEYGIGFDPKSIPPEVWQSVAKGKTLLAAYQAWELKTLKADNKAARKVAENKVRSTGSRSTFGNQHPRDQIEYDWYES